MQLTLLTIGSMSQTFYAQAQDAYLQKIQRFCPITLQEKSLKKQPKDPAARKEKEGELLLEATKGKALLCCDEHGKSLHTKDFASIIQKYHETNTDLVCCIGGTFGLSQKVLNAADRILRLSDMTLTQDLARMMLLENLYRSFAILNNFPFHKE